MDDPKVKVAADREEAGEIIMKFLMAAAEHKVAGGRVAVGVAHPPAGQEDGHNLQVFASMVDCGENPMTLLLDWSSALDLVHVTKGLNATKTPEELASRGIAAATSIVDSIGEAAKLARSFAFLMGMGDIDTNKATHPAPSTEQ